jgi:hypothetical protein
MHANARWHNVVLSQGEYSAVEERRLMVQEDWRPLLRAVMYVVQFEADPLRAIDRVLAEVINQGALGATPQAYRTALAQALASDEVLATLIPQPHPETTVRQYVALLYQRLRE